MHRRALILCLSLIAVFAVAVPTNASVASFTVGVSNPVCKLHGGQHGHGKIIATADFGKSGGSGKSYFNSIARVQRWTGSKWVAENPKASRMSNTFSNVAGETTWHVTWTYSFIASEVGKTFRVYFVYEFWDKKPGPDLREASFTRGGPSCG